MNRQSQVMFLTHKRQRVCVHILALMILLASLIAGVAQAGQAETASADPTPKDTAAMPDWLEPRGLSIVELVGQVSEQYLQGMILSYGTGRGIVVYESGSRSGNTVELTTTIYPRRKIASDGADLTIFGCLGQSPSSDHPGSVVPDSTLRLYDRNGVEVTSQINFMAITRMGTLQPLANSTAAFRYPEDLYGPGLDYELPLGADGLAIPSNGGCRIRIRGASYYPMTGVFTLEVAPSVQAIVLGSQQASFKSYIGVGNVGIFTPLMEQMWGTYGHRNWRIPLDVPQGANYFLLKFPPMAGDPYTDQSSGPPYPNASRPTGGTYRLAKNITDLSTDLTFSAAFPVKRFWKDADQAPGSSFLPVLGNPDELEAPEYVLPAGIAYNNCYTQGNCSSSILQQIYNAEMSLEIVYLAVDKPRTGGEWVSLKMAGPSWSPSSLAIAPFASDWPEQAMGNANTAQLVLDSPTTTHTTFLPLIMYSIPEEEPTGCPCGWFDARGRMLGFWP
jgi:hypothetical protein